MLQLLVAERERTTRQIAALTQDYDAIVDASVLVAIDDEHDPEGSTIAFERAQIAALLDQARRHLAELDDAVKRLHAALIARGPCRTLSR